MKVGIIVFSFLAFSLGAAAENNERMNVLFIAVDDMRAELGCYGAEHIHSPNIDRLAGAGTLFERAYCQQAVCNPSRASLLTGLRPESLRIWDLPTHFRQRVPDVVTLPQHFKNHGYHTENIGKIFHNWRQDKYKGDAPSWSVPACMHYASHGHDAPEVNGKLPADLESTPRCEMRDVADDAYFDGRVANLAVEAIGRLKEQPQPFFLAVGFWKPHADFNAPKKYWDLYNRSEIRLAENRQPPSDVPSVALHDGREIRRGFKDRPSGEPTEEDARALRHGYFAAISYVDAQVGKVLAALDEQGLREKTVIVLWSDHGFHLGEKGLWAKTSNFELDARVPLIIAAPGQTKGTRSPFAGGIAGSLSHTRWALWIAGSWARGRRQPGSDSPGFQTEVKQAAFTWHPRPAYPPSGTAPEAMGFSMRTDFYRYTEWRDPSTGKILARELYDHRSDPHESVNIAGLEPSSAVMDSLQKHWPKNESR